MKPTAALNRLNQYRAREEKLKASYPGCVPEFYSWRFKNNRHPKPNVLTRKGPKSPNYYYQPEDPREPRTMPLDSLDQWPGTEEGTASDILKLGHNGWYTDSCQSDTVFGVVLSLRTPHGRRYYPAISSKSFDVSTVYIDDWFEGEDAEREAASRADQYADSYAEDAREYDAQFQAEQQIEEAREEIKAARRQILDLCKEIKAAGKAFSPAICSALTGRVQELLHERNEAFERIDELKNNFWAAVEH